MDYTVWNIILVAIMAFVVYVIGYNHGWYKYEKILLDKSIEAELALQKAMKAKQPNCYIHKVDGIYYLFMLEDNKFITQANSYTELITHLSKNHPKQEFYISKENLKEIGEIKVDTYE